MTTKPTYDERVRKVLAGLPPRERITWLRVGEQLLRGAKLTAGQKAAQRKRRRRAGAKAVATKGPAGLKAAGAKAAATRRART